VFGVVEAHETGVGLLLHVSAEQAGGERVLADIAGEGAWNGHGSRDEQSGGERRVWKPASHALYRLLPNGLPNGPQCLRQSLVAADHASVRRRAQNIMGTRRIFCSRRG